MSKSISSKPAAKAASPSPPALKGRQRATMFVTPKGVAVWPRVDGEPDTKFKAEGTYSVKLALDPDIAEDGEFLTALEQRYNTAVESGSAEFNALNKVSRKTRKPIEVEVFDQPWSDEFEEGDGGNPTGRKLVNFKMTASGISKKTGKPWQRKPIISDAKGARVTKELGIGGGSVIKVAFTYNPFVTEAGGVGLSLRLEGVQVLSLEQFAGRDPKSMGFKEEEGFDFAAETAVDAETEPASEDADY